MKDYACKKFLRPHPPTGEWAVTTLVAVLVTLLGLVMLGFMSDNDARVLAELNR